jgi:hypothetical protein
MSNEDDGVLVLDPNDFKVPEGSTPFIPKWDPANALLLVKEMEEAFYAALEQKHGLEAVENVRKHRASR